MGSWRVFDPLAAAEGWVNAVLDLLCYPGRRSLRVGWPWHYNMYRKTAGPPSLLTSMASGATVRATCRMLTTTASYFRYFVFTNPDSALGPRRSAKAVRGPFSSTNDS